jgi:CheY-like chemotaxis protein
MSLSILIALVLLAGGVGYFFYDRRQNKLQEAHFEALRAKRKAKRAANAKKQADVDAKRQKDIQAPVAVTPAPEPLSIAQPPETVTTIPLVDPTNSTWWDPEVTTTQAIAEPVVDRTPLPSAPEQDPLPGIDLSDEPYEPASVMEEHTPTPIEEPDAPEFATPSDEDSPVLNPHVEVDGSADSVTEYHDFVEQSAHTSPKPPEDIHVETSVSSVAIPQPEIAQEWEQSLPDTSVNASSSEALSTEFAEGVQPDAHEPPSEVISNFASLDAPLVEAHSPTTEPTLSDDIDDALADDLVADMNTGDVSQVLHEDATYSHSTGTPPILDVTSEPAEPKTPLDVVESTTGTSHDLHGAVDGTLPKDNHPAELSSTTLEAVSSRSAPPILHESPDLTSPLSSSDELAALLGADTPFDFNAPFDNDLDKLLAPISQPLSAAPDTTVPSVLLVDDSRSFRIRMETILKEGGCRVTTCLNGREAFDLLRGAAPPYVDIIISDIDMPEMDGYTFFAALQAEEKLKNIPFIIVTGSYENVEKASRLGVKETLVKPFNEKDIEEALRRQIPQFF